MLNRNTNSIIVRSYIQLGENALAIVRNNKNGNETSSKQKKLWYDSAKIRVLLKVVEFRERQDYTVTNKFLSCLVNLTNINDYPAAPLLFNTIKRSVILPAGPQGEQGVPGLDGADANIGVITDPIYDNIAVTEVDVGGVKTFKIGYSPYTEPTISTAVNKGFLSPSSVYRETGEVLGSVPLTITLTKGREPVTSSVFTDPTSLDTAYQLELNLTSLNSTGSQIISTINPTNVSASDSYTVNISDGTNTNQSTADIYFNYPVLYGKSAALGITYYTALTKYTRSDGGIQTLGSGLSVLFNGTDEYFWFGLHNSQASITEILDGSGFNVTADFTVMTLESVTSTSLDSNWTENYTFYRTTNKTSINNQTYRFNT